MCVVLEHLQLLSKRSSLGRGTMAGGRTQPKTSPERARLVVGYAETPPPTYTDQDGRESSAVHGFCPNKKLVEKRGVSGTWV